MRNWLTVFGLTAVILGDCLILAQDSESELPAILVLPEDSEIMTGDSIRFQAVYVDTAGQQTDTTVVWSVIPDSLGTIDTTGLFIAELSGICAITGTLDTLTGWADIFIGDTSDVDLPVPDPAYIILPSDTTVTLGAEIHYIAYHATQSGHPGERVVDNLAWTLEGMPVG
ncbi:MAG: hypothetical protein V3W14_12665, partial [Candidatus Neomarinimicrobiota bacterium]